ncbi:MAG: long-chain-fatty-acid--CoA ligase [Syntrophales bacterium]|jgi:acyl-CoA synthetase (AMP-forming)/AMP-acid ligase II|nr:long-chain-fatty-acid--CoA ligase [Syntrophales bacterium]
MKTLQSKLGWALEEVEGPDFKGKIYKNRPKNVVEILENTVTAYPDKEGFIYGNLRLTFKEFDGIVNRIAAGLEKLGVQKDDHVAILLGIQLEFPLIFFALMKLGALAVPLNTRFKGEELAYEINDSESKLLIVDEEYWPFIDSVRDQLKTVRNIFYNGDNVPGGVLPFQLLKDNKEEIFTQAKLSETDDALIMYTSGTTGKPKGAVLQQRGLVLTAMLVSDFMCLQPGDKMIACIPLFHITGLNQVMIASINSGISCVYMRTFKTKEFLQLLSSEKVTAYIGVINIIWLMINHPDFDQYDFSSFKTAFFGGSPATEEMVKGIFKKLPNLNISVGYGLTESFGMVCTTPYEDVFRKIRGVGKMLPTVEAKIVDVIDAGKELPPESVGEILLRSAKITKGYWKNPEATKATITSDGWLHTGDIGKMDDEGFLYIMDRKKDMIIRGGEKIYSQEVENLIFDYKKVMEVAVVGVPDSVMGEVVKAVIVLKEGERATEDEIKQFCAERLADYKIPKFIEFASSLPRNPAGKLIKAELRYVPNK